jgi:hypothetical protein
MSIFLSYQGCQLIQKRRTANVLELQRFRLNDKAIDKMIVSSPLPGYGSRGPLRVSFGAMLHAACMTSMISKPRYGSTSELHF